MSHFSQKVGFQVAAIYFQCFLRTRVPGQHYTEKTSLRMRNLILVREIITVWSDDFFNYVYKTGWVRHKDQLTQLRK